MLRDRTHKLKDEIERIARDHRAVRPRLFGSVARGEVNPDSDVDFLVQQEHGHSVLEQLRECIANTESDSAGGRDVIMEPRTFQDAIIRRFQVIGDAARRTTGLQ